MRSSYCCCCFCNGVAVYFSSLIYGYSCSYASYAAPMNLNFLLKMLSSYTYHNCNYVILSFICFINSSHAPLFSFFFFLDIRAYSRCYCLFRCWIYRKLPICWGIWSTSWSWSTSYLQFGKHVYTWCGGCWFHILFLWCYLSWLFCAFIKLPRFDCHLLEWLALAY